MNNLHDIRTGLAEVFSGLREGTIDRRIATEMINAAGKMINSAKIELEYQVLRQKHPSVAPISFIEPPKPKKEKE